MSSYEPHSLIHEAGGRQLGVEAMSKDLLELALMMVEALLVLVIHAPDINYNIARVQDGRISATLDIWYTSTVSV